MSSKILLSDASSDTPTSIFSFKLHQGFVASYLDREVNFGYPDAAGNALGEIVFIRSYSRLKVDGSKETWIEVCERVINGMYSIQKNHATTNRLPWSDEQAMTSAKEAFERMFTFKWLPPGRGMWMMGTDYVMRRHNSAALNNCSFVNTGEFDISPSEPFCFLMEASMLGIGVGFDTNMSLNNVRIHEPAHLTQLFVIEDSREGWVESVEKLLDSYFLPKQPIWEFDYTLIRGPGLPIKGFGGTSSGPDPLIKLHKILRTLLGNKVGQAVDTELVVDIANLIGVCVVAGNVRRSALIAIGSSADEEFIHLKDATWYPERNSQDPENKGWGWMSNNSIVAEVGMDYSSIVPNIAMNGEPGIIWLDMARNYGRLIDPPDARDYRVAGVNPCSEQPLESSELCTLVECFLNHHETKEDFLRTLKFAYLYAKTVTLVPTHWPKTNSIMQRNRRIGTSISGIADFADEHGLPELRTWMDEGYAVIQRWDKMYSEWLCVRESIKTTTVKPSGCRPWDALTTTTAGILTLEEMFKASDHKENTTWCDVPTDYFSEQGDTTNRITKTFDNGKAKVLSIKMSYGMEVRSTLNHKWWVAFRYDRSKRNSTKRRKPVNAWVTTENLLPGDVLEVSLGMYNNKTESVFRNLDSRSISMKGDATQIKQPIHMTPDIAWLLGYLWGDGAMSPSSYRLRWIDGNISHLEKASSILYETFGISSAIKVASQGRRANVIDVGSKMLWHWLIKNNIWKYDTSGHPDHIPEIVRRSSKESVIAFIAGLIDADGCVVARTKERTVVLASAYDDFARHIQDVSASVGILFGRSLNARGQNKQKLKHMWLMSMGPDTLHNSLGLLEKHSLKMSVRSDLPWSPILRKTSSTRILGKIDSIEDLGFLNTFDIEVENSHWYYAGAIKSHNSVSIVSGASPGVHWSPGGTTFLRAVRFADDSPLVPAFAAAGYTVEDAVVSDNTKVIYFPVNTTPKRSQTEVTIWEKANLAALSQRHWSDNAVSVTISFSPEEAKHIATVLHMFEGQLKTVSFLPSSDTVYPQMPYAPLALADYEAYVGKLKKVDFAPIYAGLAGTMEDAAGERYCTTDTCEIGVPPAAVEFED
jgi:hypothetical protein